MVLPKVIENLILEYKESLKIVKPECIMHFECF